MNEVKSYIIYPILAGCFLAISVLALYVMLLGIGGWGFILWGMFFFMAMAAGRLIGKGEQS